MSKLPFKSIAFLLIAIVFLSLIWVTRTGRLDPRPYSDRGLLIPVEEEGKYPVATIPVLVGSYVENIYDFAVQEQTFSAEGWVWLTWTQEFQDLLTARQLTMEKCLLLANAVQSSDFILKSENGNPTRLPDGRYYQIFRYSGKFYASKLDFRRFPFEKLRLPIVFSLNPEFAFLGAAHVRLLAEKTQSGVGEYIDIPGYVTTGQALREYIYAFRTNLGMAADPVDKDARFSRVQMEILYAKSNIASLLQLFLPLVVVMSVVLLSPNLAGSLWDVRIALPSTALLTLVFLQQSYRTELPTLPYLTFLDQVYALCYATTLTLFCLFVASSNRLDQAPENEKAAVIAQINRTDLRFQVALTVGLVTMVCLSWFFPVR